MFLRRKISRKFVLNFLFGGLGFLSLGLLLGNCLIKPIEFKEASAAISDTPTLVGNILDNNDWNIAPRGGDWKLTKTSTNEFNILGVKMRTHNESDFRIIDYNIDNWRTDMGWNQLYAGNNAAGFESTGDANNCIHITKTSYYNLYLHYKENNASTIDIYYAQEITTTLECQIWLDGSKLAPADAASLGFDFDFTYDDSSTSKYSSLGSSKRITVHNYKDMYVTNWTVPAGYSFSDYQIGYTDNTTSKTAKNVHVKQWATELKKNGSWSAATNYINMYFTTNRNTITLNQQSGSGGTSTIYEKLNKGFYLDASCSKTMTTSANKVTAPTRTGYTFGGYWTNTGGGGTQIINSAGKIMNNNASFATFTGDTTIYAKWTAKTFNINYNLNDGTHGTNHPSSGTYDKVFAVSAPTKTGHTFTGWTVTSGLNSSVARWGTTSSPATAISSTSTKCVNGTSDVYFKNINAVSDSVTFTANWDTHEDDLMVASYQQNYGLVEATGMRYEAEEATLTNADIKLLSGTGSYAFGVSGEGFVGFSGQTVSKISFSVSTKTKGVYQLYIKYAVGMDNSGVRVTCNGVSEKINYPYNNGWGSFNITQPILTSVRLNSGENTIELSKSGAEKYGEIDYIEIGDCIEVDIAPDLPHGTSWTKYEAENGEVISATRKSGTASGSKYVGNIDNEYSYIDFNLSLEETGSYEIKIKYATGFSDRPITVYAGERGRDGRLEFYASLSTTVTSWGNFAHTASCFVGLKKNSFIRIYSRYVEIDYLELSNKVGDFFNGVTSEIAPDEDITDGGFTKLG